MTCTEYDHVSSAIKIFYAKNIGTKRQQVYNEWSSTQKVVKLE